MISHYRKKRYRTQAEFAIASGFTVRAIQEWETAMMTHDLQRRIFLARMLRIPPALLGLDWRLVTFDTNKGEYKDPLQRMAELIEEDSYYTYEDILVMGHEYIHNGGLLEIPYRVDRRLRKLIEITKHARASDEDAWKTLLCKYYQLSTRIKQQCMKDDATASIHARLAVELAIELQDSELIASALVNTANTNEQQGKSDEARKDIAAAIECIDAVRNGPLKGNIYLEAAEINAPFALGDEKLQSQCKTWQDKAANMLYKDGIEPDQTFFRFNLSAVHHEKAKTLLCWQKNRNDRQAVRGKLTAALETLAPDLNVWKVYYYMTQAHLELVDHDIEASAQLGKEALKTAKIMHSKMEEENVRSLYYTLHEAAPNNPYVNNLGVELGIF